MRNSYVAALRRHLLLPNAICNEIVRELSSHMYAETRERHASEKEILGDPHVLAQKFNATHIPLYRYIFSEYWMIGFLISLLIVIRFTAIKTGILLEQIYPTGMIRMEIGGSLYHLFIISIIYALRLWKYVFYSWKILLLVIALQALSMGYLLWNNILFSLSLLIVEIIKSVAYCILIPLYLTSLSQGMRKRWISWMVR